MHKNRLCYLSNFGMAKFANSYPAKVEGPPPPTFSTGIPELNHALGGGIHPYNLVLVFGMIASGKTTFCRTILEANQHLQQDLCCAEGGSTDLLFLNQKNAYHIPDTYEAPEWTFSNVSVWEIGYLRARSLKGYCAATKEAVIWTVPTIGPTEDDESILENNSSIMRLADSIISLRRNTSDFTLYILKNRKARNGISINLRLVEGETGMIFAR